MNIHYLALHEIFPPFDLRIAIPLFVGVVGVVLAPIFWVRGRPRGRHARRPRPPLARIVLVAVLIASVITGAFLTDSDVLVLPLMPFIWAAVPFGALFSALTDNEALLIWLGVTFCWTGIGTAFWWIRGNSRGWPEVAGASEQPAVPEIEARSLNDACIHCRESAAAGGGAPLSRVAHNADGPRFLYRCAKCHSYWQKDVKGMRPISVLRVRRDFPAVVI